MSSPSAARLIEYLSRGEMVVTGQFMWGSNYTFFCDIKVEETELKAVYKPVRGERPLWDFPSKSLSGREVAAYLVSEHGGWGFVPPTIFRQEAPAGPGSVQLFIEHDPEYHFLSFSPEDRLRSRPAALFDVVVNNADRKAGHVLIDEADKLWLIDHGVCFHVQPKLRTVIWDFAGLPLIPVEQEQLLALGASLAPGAELYQQLGDYLSRQEIQAMIDRIDRVLAEGEFPYPGEDWPATPWPPV